MKNRIAALALLAALALTGCAGTAAPEGDERATSAESESAQPLAAETPAAQDDTGAPAFVDAVRESLAPNTQIPDATDEQLIAVGEAACARIAAGESLDGASLIEGEQPNGIGGYDDTNMIIVAAKQHLCG